MPRPTSATTVGRADLAQIAYEYAVESSQRGFIGTQILPVFPVTEQSAEYPTIPLEALLKIPDTKRGARGQYNRGDYEFEMGNYSCREHGWEEVLDDSERKLYARLFDAEEVAVTRAVDIVLRDQEKRIADKLFNTSNFSVHNVTNEWDDAANATPISDVATGRKSVRSACGMEPNALILGKSVFDNVLQCSNIASKLQYTQPIEMMTIEEQKRALARVLKIEHVFVGDAVKDGAKKGQSFSASDLWSNEYGLLARVSTRPNDLREPCVGRTFLWDADSDVPYTVEQYRDETVRSDIFRVRNNTDECFVFKGCCYLLGNLTT